MPRSKNTPAPAGHNGAPLTDDEIADLQHFHAMQIKKLQQVADAKALEAKSARDAVNGQFAMVKHDLQYTRLQFQEVLDKAAMTEAEFVSSEVARNKRLANHGLPVGAQMDMFKADTATDPARAYSEGHRAGVRADDPTPPSTVSPILHPDWMKGWTDGQDVNLQRFARGAEIANARAAKDKKADVGLKAQPETEGDEGEEEDGVDRDLKALEAKGWTQPTAEEQAFA